MKYRCQMCKDRERGADNRKGFVAHMLGWHAVTITVEEVLELEGLGKRKKPGRDAEHERKYQRDYYATNRKRISEQRRRTRALQGFEG